MEWLVSCPICNQKGLINSQGSNVSKKSIVCENEFYRHFQIGQMHFLAHLIKDDQDVEFKRIDTLFCVTASNFVLN